MGKEHTMKPDDVIHINTNVKDLSTFEKIETCARILLAAHGYHELPELNYSCEFQRGAMFQLRVEVTPGNHLVECMLTREGETHAATVDRLFERLAQALAMKCVEVGKQLQALQALQAIAPYTNPFGGT